MLRTLCRTRLRIRQYTDNVIDYHLNHLKDKRVPMVYAMIIYHGRKCYPYSTDIRDLVHAADVVKEYFGELQLIDLSKIQDSEILKDSRVGVMEYLLKHIHEDDPLPYILEITDNLKLLNQSGYGKHVSLVLQYAMERGEIGDPEAFFKLVTSRISVNVGGTVMSLGEQLRNEGLREGLQQGRLKGVQEGRLEEKLEVAKRMLKAGADRLFVANITGLPVEKIITLEIYTDH